GSVFRIFLPQYNPVKEAPKVETFFKASMGNSRILLVDDEENLVVMNKKFFNKLGYNVTATTSGDEAFDCFARAPQSFDLVITDQTMPGITGIDLALKIHAIRSDLPIILCTGNTTILSQDKAHEAGIVDVLLKPVSFDALMSIVEKILVPDF
ncbi:MAG: response regulator, partial [Desulfobulbaceae bacterium]|nr:response regulator [Desulfobulbaceae bacterium]